MRQTKPVIAMFVTLGAATAAADSKGLVTDKLSAQLEPFGKLATAEREKQMCANGDALLKTAMAISSKQVPKGVPLDETTWRRYVGDVHYSLDSIVDLCKLPGHQRKGIGNEITTVNAAIKDLFDALPALVDVARPRTLSPPLAAARKSIEALNWESKAFCRQAKTVVKQLASAPRPDHADAGKWDTQLADVKERASELQGIACSKQKLEPEEVAGLPVGLSEAFYKLVLLVPAS